MPNAIGTNAIGPSFGDEIERAGLAGKPFSWTPKGEILFAPSMSAADRQAVEAVYAAHDPASMGPNAMLAKKLAAGCAIASPTRPYLNATYPIDDLMQRRAQAIAAGINAGRAFPHRAATYKWPAVGTQVTFQSTADAIDVFTALEDYVSDLVQTEASLATGNPAVWPAQPVTIA